MIFILLLEGEHGQLMGRGTTELLLDFNHGSRLLAAKHVAPLLENVLILLWLLLDRVLGLYWLLLRPIEHGSCWCCLYYALLPVA